jgi:hypothetical protein
MPHLLLIIEPVGQREARGLEGGQAAYAQMLAFTDELKQAGVLMASSALSSAVTRLDRQDPGGTPRVVDGPFAEAKELIGGFFLISCERREDALAWAARCPAAAFAQVEVRETGPCYT